MNKIKALYIAGMLLVAAPALAQKDSLQTYMEAAIRNNPAVIAEYKAYKAQAISCLGAGQLNDPEVNIGVYPGGMQHVNVKQIMTVSVMQMFPWFGTLKNAKQMQMQKAEVAFQKFREDGVAIVYDVQRQWYQILATQEQIKAIEDNLKVLGDVKKIALYQYTAASNKMNAKMSSQLRIEAEEVKLQEQIASLKDKLELQKQQLNLFMHRSAESRVVLPDSMEVRELPAVNWAELEKNNPRLQMLEAERERYRAQGEMAKNQGKPMFGVGVQYMLNSKVDMPMMESMNGKDMLMPMVKVTLPIYRKKTNASVKAAELMQESTKYNYQRQQDVLRSAYLGIEQRAADAKREMALYDKEMQLLDRTLELMRAEYATGATSLTDILATSRETINYALKKFEAQAKYNTIVAEYEKLATVYDYAVK